jgi:hypothetical protein
MVVVFGTNFGPTALAKAGSYPLPGTSAQVTAGSVTKNLIMIYTSASQLAGIIPSSVPAGKASITVSYNGKTSFPQTFTIVTASFGISPQTAAAMARESSSIRTPLFTPPLTRPTLTISPPCGALDSAPWLAMRPPHRALATFPAVPPLCLSEDSRPSFCIKAARAVARI